MYIVVAQAVFAAVGGWIGYFLGGNDGLLYALLAFVVLDYITGVMCAVADKKLSSAVGFKGICRKVLIFALVGIGHLLDTQVIGSGSVLRTAIIFFFGKSFALLSCLSRGKIVCHCDYLSSTFLLLGFGCP